MELLPRHAPSPLAPALIVAGNRYTGRRLRGKSKIERLSAKKGKIYAQIRLSPQLADTIGEIADVFETERDGKRAFLLVINQNVLNNDMVLQPSEIIVKPDGGTNNNLRFEALESQTNELKLLLFSNESLFPHKNENRWARPDSNRRPPPCEGGGVGAQDGVFRPVSAFFCGCGRDNHKERKRSVVYRLIDARWQSCKL